MTALSTTEIYTLSLHDALPILTTPENFAGNTQGDPEFEVYMHTADAGLEVRVPVKAGDHEVGVTFVRRLWEDRKSTRLNSSHTVISYVVFWLKKKTRY